MDPRFIGLEQWELINRALIHLVLFVGLAVNAALSLLLGHGIIPSLVTSGHSPPEILRFRTLLYPVFAASLLLTLYAFARGLWLAVDVIQQIYPRFAL